MFVIFGTKGVPSRQGGGEFYCPNCGADREYDHISVRRFFTLFFFPVIPLDQVGEYVECKGCDGTFRPEVLSYDPRQAEQEILMEFEVVMRRVISLMVMVDGELHEDEARTVSRVHQQVTGRPLAPDEIRQEASSIRRARKEMIEYLPAMAASLNDHGKEMILSAATMVAQADGRMDTKELKLLMEIGQHLEMSKAHIRGVLAEQAA